MEENVVLFESADRQIRLDDGLDGETVWLTQKQMAELFGKERSVVTRHINSAFKQGELDREGNVRYVHIPGSDRPVSIYSIDVILSVAYRVNSQRGVEFRRWATDVLHRYIVDGHAENDKRLGQLGEAASIKAPASTGGTS